VSGITLASGRWLMIDSVKYVVGDDDSFPAPKEGNKRLSAASAALDLAPLAQTQHRAVGQRPFETGLKTSDWPNFQSGPNRGMTSPLPSQLGLDPQSANTNGQLSLDSRKTSPTGMADSIASLPALPSKSVPGTPFGFGMGGGPRTRTPNAQDGLSQAQRGYSNPDLARSFGKSGGFSALDNGAPRVGLDPYIYPNVSLILSLTTLTPSTMSTLPTELLWHPTLPPLRSPQADLTHTDSTMMDTVLALFTPAVLSA